MTRPRWPWNVWLASDTSCSDHAERPRLVAVLRLYRCQTRLVSRFRCQCNSLCRSVGRCRLASILVLCGGEVTAWGARVQGPNCSVYDSIICSDIRHAKSRSTMQPSWISLSVGVSLHSAINRPVTRLNRPPCKKMSTPLESRGLFGDTCCQHSV